MKRDAEAFACLSQAASATRWEDYASGEPRGRIALLGAANGDIGAVRRLGLTACTILPHYTRLRAMARIALYRAMVLERNGQVAEGVRIRSDIRRLAALMRDRSTLTIGCLVGIAIGHMAVRRPGGAPDRRGTGAEGEERDALVLRREQAYLQFLRKAGMEAEAGRAASDMAAMQLAHRVLRQVVAPDRWPEVATPSARAAVAALCALVTVAWMLVAALVGIVAALSSRVRAGQPATWAQRLGALWAAVALGLWAADALVPVHSSDMAAAIWCAILLPWLLAAGVCARRRWRRSARSWALAALGGAAVCALLYLVTRAAVLRAGATAGLAVTLSGFSNPEAQAEVARAWIPSLHPLLFVPVLGVALALVLWRRRTPLSVGYARVLASGGPAVICLLMVLYAGYTARQALVEAASSSRLEALIENEVRLLTRETGQDWPVMAQHDATPR
jgi:hypothetical protein